MEITIKCKCGATRTITFDELNDLHNKADSEGNMITIYVDYDPRIAASCSKCNNYESI